MTSNIKQRRLAARSALVQERAGIPSSRTLQRQIAAANKPDNAPVVTPLPITAAIKGGGAMKQLLEAADALGHITDQSTVGTDPIVPLSSSAAALDDLVKTGLAVRTGPGGFSARKLIAFLTKDDHRPGAVVVKSTTDTSDVDNNTDGALGDLVFRIAGVLAFWNDSASGLGIPVKVAAPLGRSWPVGGYMQLAAGASGNITIANPAGSSGSSVANPTIDIVAVPEFAALIVDGLIRWGGVSGTPTITFLAGAGTGPSLTSYTGGDYAGKIVFRTGTAPAAGGQVNIAFQNALGNANYQPILTSFGSNGAGVQPYVTSQATTGWSFGFNVAPSASTTYQFEVRIAGR